MAIEEYRRSVRPPRIVYASVIATVLVIAGVVSAIVYSTGEIARTTLTTTATPAPSVAAAATDTRLSKAWEASESLAIGTPYAGGTVVTFGEHSVSGRAANTGGTIWTYERSDRIVCTAAQMQDYTLAIFELNGNCDEMTALDSQTGQRRWTRTFDKDGQPIVGHPTFQVSGSTLMMTTPRVIYALEPTSGLDRWTFSQSGCTINSAVFGSTGALISQNCTEPDCSGGKKFCGPGQQLLLRDPDAGRSDDGDNRDQLTWNLIGSTLRPVSADTQVLALDGRQTLTVLEPKGGGTTARITLPQPVSDSTTAAALGSAELIHADTQTMAVSDSALLWHTSTSAIPTVSAPVDGTALEPATARLAVPHGVGAVLLDGTTGKIAHTVSLDPQPSATTTAVYPFGAGLLIGGDGSTALYR